MGKETRVYDPKTHIITFGPVLLSGFSEDEMCEFEPETEGFSDVVGVDGEVTVAPNSDDRGTATIHLMQSSPVNAQLSAIYNIAKKAPNMAGGIHPFKIKDMTGTYVLFAANAWILAKPSDARGKEAQAKEWQIRLAHCEGVD